MLNIGPQELLIVLIIALVVVGPQRLPELGRSIGKALRELRKIQDDVKDTIKFDLNDGPQPHVRPRQVPRTPQADRTEVAGQDVLPTDVPGPAPAAEPRRSGNDAPTETETDPEPRAVE